MDLQRPLRLKGWAAPEQLCCSWRRCPGWHWRSLELTGKWWCDSWCTYENLVISKSSASLPDRWIQCWKLDCKFDTYHILPYSTTSSGRYEWEITKIDGVCICICKYNYIYIYIFGIYIYVYIYIYWYVWSRKPQKRWNSNLLVFCQDSTFLFSGFAMTIVNVWCPKIWGCIHVCYDSGACMTPTHSTHTVTYPPVIKHANGKCPGSNH